MRITKKILSFVLVIAVLFTTLPLSGSETKAATGGVQEKINQIKAVYPTGTYFTSNGKAHHMTDPSVCPDVCNVCNIKNIPARGSLPSGASTGFDGYQCWAFASYASYIIFGNGHFSSWGQVSLANAKLGDVVKFKMSSGYDHYGIFLSASGSTVTVYDANSDYYCKVVYGSSYSSSYVTNVYHSGNYDKINGQSSYTYTSITPGTYYLKNNNSGNFLCVTYATDANKQNINVYAYGASYKGEEFQITSTGNGYKMRPLCSSSRVVNAWGDNPSDGANVNLYDDLSNSTQWWKFEAVSGGYVIHNVYNPSLVLDVDGSNNAVVKTKTGAASQIWSLVPLNHTCDKGQYQYYQETHPHKNCYKCSICGTIWADDSSSNYVSSCTTCNPPHTCTFSGKTEVITEATCSTAGTKRVYCTDTTCGKYETVSIAAKGHQYTDQVVAPTPDTQGYTEHTCSVCGDSYKDNYIDYVAPNVPQIVMDSTTIAAGREITLNLRLQENTGIAGLAVSLKYDESVLSLKEVRKGDLFSGFTSGKNFVWDESDNVMENGVLATFVFTVAENASAGDYTIEVISRSCTNADLEDVVPKTVAGTITVIDYIYGDANGDGEIDMKDVVLVQKYMANFDYTSNTSTIEVELGADANGDGKISGLDAVRLKRYLADYDYETGSSSVILGPSS